MDIIPHPLTTSLYNNSNFAYSLIIVKHIRRFKWIQVMKDSTTETIIDTIKILQYNIQHLIPTTEICHIRSDSGSQFLSNKFLQYFIDNKSFRYFIDHKTIVFIKK